MFQKTLENFSIHFNVTNGRNAFSSGDLITGHFSFDLTKESNITYVMVAVAGKAEVHWSTGGGGKKSRRRHYSAKLEFFNIRSTILQNTGDVSRSTRLQAGTHVYPFTCQLPHGDFPSTFQGIHGKIIYTLTVSIKRPWHISKDFVTELNFVSYLNLNQPELWSPLSGSNNMTVCCLWCASGPISLTATTERKAFTPGETVKIVCDMNNSSNRRLTPQVKLRRKQQFFTRNKSNRRLICQTLTSMTGDPIIGPNPEVHAEYSLQIPATAGCTISNCSILEVEYVIEMNLKVSGSSEVTVLFPIILFTPSVNPQAQLSSQ